MGTNEYRKVSFTGAYDLDNSIYVSDSLFNGLLKLDKKTGQATYEARFVEEGILRQGLHGRVYRFGDELIFTPDRAGGIHVYNIVQKSMRYFILETGDGKQSRCIDSFLDNDKLWLFYAYAEQPVIIFDLLSHTQESFYGIKNILPQEIKERQKPVFWGNLEKSGRKIYAGIWESPYIIQLDIDTKKTEIYAVDDLESRITGLAFDGEFFWITEFERTFVKKWKPQGNSEVILVPDGLVEGKNLVYSNIIYHDKKVILIPNSGEDILSVDEDSASLRAFCKLPDCISKFCDVRSNWRRFFFYDILDEKLLRLYPAGVDMMVDINLQTAEAVGCAFKLDDTWNDDKYKHDIIYTYIKETSHQNYLSELDGIELKHYLDYISENEKIETKNEGTSIGEKIWEYVINEL